MRLVSVLDYLVAELREFAMEAKPVPFCFARRPTFQSVGDHRTMISPNVNLAHCHPLGQISSHGTSQIYFEQSCRPSARTDWSAVTITTLVSPPLSLLLFITSTQHPTQVSFGLNGEDRIGLGGEVVRCLRRMDAWTMDG